MYTGSVTMFGQDELGTRRSKIIRRVGRKLSFVAFLVLIGIGSMFRANVLTAPPLWVDEAESAINALTILERGVPVDRYLGIPIYENTLLKPWPEHAEYEFKDLSYSARGLAVYHGWLPLYAIAGSFALFGIQPDAPGDLSSLERDLAELQKRTLAARLPSLAFSVVFMLLVFRAGKEFYGPEAAWSALTITAVSTSFVWHGIQARYYSATLMLAAALCLLTLRVWKQGRWRDYIAAAVVFVLLFHTHVLTSFIGAVMFLLIVPALCGQKRSLWKLATFGAICVSGTVPWMIYSGFLDHFGQVPGAWALLSLPWDMVDYLTERDRLTYLAVCLIGGAWLLMVRFLPARIPGRVRLAFQGHGREFSLLYGWLVVGVVAFLALIPAPSFFFNRLSVAVAAPGIILASMFMGAAARAVSVRRGTPVAAAGCLGLLLVAGELQPLGLGLDKVTAETYSPIGLLKQVGVEGDTRVYATPSDQLIHSFYAGIPVQSVAPVRKHFLDSYDGQVLLIARRALDDIRPGDPLFWRHLQERAREAGIALSDEEAKEWQERLATWSLRSELVSEGFTVRPAPEELPQYLSGTVTEQQRKLIQARDDARLQKWSTGPMFRGYEIGAELTWWQVFFYRFVDPEGRGGKSVNYARRMRNATVYVPPRSRWMVYQSPPSGQGATDVVRAE
ncbi:MAG: glycosyltransferase family 39 protein [Gammaproteobacteria bacterium]|nr:glycosyltransferase family 39 protein [Gammaproteobacteria bacterium]